MTDKEVAGAYISAFERLGDEDALFDLLTQHRRFNEDGTPVKGTRFGDTPELSNDILAAIDRIKAKEKKQNKEAAEALEAEARTKLENAGSVEEANAISAEYAPQIRAEDPDVADSFVKNQEKYPLMTMNSSMLTPFG